MSEIATTRLTGVINFNTPPPIIFLKVNSLLLLISPVISARRRRKKSGFTVQNSKKTVLFWRAAGMKILRS